MNIKAIIQIFQLLMGLWQAYSDWKKRHPDAPQPTKDFIEAKVLNVKSTPTMAVPSTLVSGPIQHLEEAPAFRLPQAAQDKIDKQVEEDRAKTEAAVVAAQKIQDGDVVKAIKQGKSVVADMQPGAGSDPALGYVQNDPQKQKKKK